LFFRFDPVTNYLFPTCPFYATTGMYCPGCGSQRATHALLHLDFIAVFKRNLLFIPGIILLFYHYTIKLINHFLDRNISSFLDYKYTPVILLIIVIVFGILRNLNFSPFSYLAP
jgi:hypothetical protein